MHHSRQKRPFVSIYMFVSMFVLYCSPQSCGVFSGKGSWTSERGSSGFFSFTLGKTFDCTNELHIHGTILKSQIQTNHNKMSLNINSETVKYPKQENCNNYLSKTHKPTHSQKDLQENRGVTALALRWYETATSSPQNTEKSTGMCWGSHESWKQT